MLRSQTIGFSPLPIPCNKINLKIVVESKFLWHNWFKSKESLTFIQRIPIVNILLQFDILNVKYLRLSLLLLYV